MFTNIKSNFKAMKPIDPIEDLKIKSGNILNVFTNTIVQLNEVNHQVNDGISIRNNKITKLTDENNELNEIKLSNTKMIDKLNQILN